MRIWATSCLHLNLENLDYTLGKIRDELKDAAGDTVILNGDIIDATRDWHTCLVSLKTTLDALKIGTVLWIKGNNDLLTLKDIAKLDKVYRFWPESEIVFQGYISKLTSIVGHTGVNDRLFLWSHAHDLATSDQINEMYGRLNILCGFPMGENRGSLGPDGLVLHYPLISTARVLEEVKTDTGSRLEYRMQEIGQVKKFYKLLRDFPNIKFIVFGHVHPWEMSKPWGGAEYSTDFIPASVTVDDRVVQIYTVSDHREKFMHEVWNDDR